MYDKIPNARTQKSYKLVLFLCRRHNMLVEIDITIFFRATGAKCVFSPFHITL
jgi:hypothetical protein